MIAILFAAFLQRKLDDHHPVSNVVNRDQVENRVWGERIVRP